MWNTSSAQADRYIKGSSTFWEWRRRREALKRKNYLICCILKIFKILFGKPSLENVWTSFLAYHLRHTDIYTDIHTVILNQTYSPRAEGRLKSSILQLPFNYAYDLPQSNFTSCTIA